METFYEKRLFGFVCKKTRCLVDIFETGKYILDIGVKSRKISKSKNHWFVKFSSYKKANCLKALH